MRLNRRTLTAATASLLASVGHAAPMSLLSFGQVVPFAEIAPELHERVERRGVQYPKALRKWLDYPLEHNPKGVAIVFPPGTRLNGDLDLDGTQADIRKHNVIAVVATGDLAIDGVLRNRNLNGGPLLFVAGHLSAKRVEKGGANIVVLGDLKSEGVVLCDYNDGVLRVVGDLTSQALIALDHDVEVMGRIIGPKIHSDHGELRAALVDEVFENADDDWAEGDLIRKRLAEGLPVLRAR